MSSAISMKWYRSLWEFRFNQRDGITRGSLLLLCAYFNKIFKADLERATDRIAKWRARGWNVGQIFLQTRRGRVQLFESTRDRNWRTSERNISVDESPTGLSVSGLSFDFLFLALLPPSFPVVLPLVRSFLPCRSGRCIETQDPWDGPFKARPLRRMSREKGREPKERAVLPT